MIAPSVYSAAPSAPPQSSSAPTVRFATPDDDKFVADLQELAFGPGRFARTAYRITDREGLEQMHLGPLRRELSRYAREFGTLRSALTRALSARRGVAESPLAEHLPGLLQDALDYIVRAQVSA